MALSAEKSIVALPLRCISIGVRTLAWAMCALIRAYQLLIAPVLPASCRYYPSCSAYAIEALERHGIADDPDRQRAAVLGRGRAGGGEDGGGGEHRAAGGYIQGRTMELNEGSRIVQSWRTSEFPLMSPSPRVSATAATGDHGLPFPPRGPKEM